MRRKRCWQQNRGSLQIGAQFKPIHSRISPIFRSTASNWMPPGMPTLPSAATTCTLPNSMVRSGANRRSMPAWGVGSGAALALDGSGKAHISYYDASNQDLKYATNKSGLWVTETVVSSGDVGIYSDIAIDGWGDPSIVYFNESTDTLHYINFDHFIPAWVDETIATAQSPDHNGWFSFALDTHVIPNRPHVSYYMYASGNVRGIKICPLQCQQRMDKRMAGDLPGSIPNGLQSW